MRVAIYARYSSDNQREASIEDQIRECRTRAGREGWHVAEIYSDAAISGASLLRPGIQQLMRDAIDGKFDLVLCEALDRLSRDQEDIAGFYKRMAFNNVIIFTLSEGEISNLHIGLKGTMNALFLKDLADKTRRGLRGRVEQGKSGGGITYGYDVLKRIDANGDYAKGERSINEAEATVVRRIFKEMIRGDSPRAVAKRLNDEGLPGPQGGPWNPSTIYGNRKRGTGIVNNELYIVKVVWNRLRYVKDPETGKRISRLNPEDQWVRTDAPELRIIDQETWDRYREVQGEFVPNNPLFRYNRPKNLLSGLMQCGCCGGGYILVNRERIGCANRRNRGTCGNGMTMPLATIEAKVLSALQTHLMDDELCEIFCREYTRHMNELRARHNASLAGYRAEYAKLERERQQIIRAIADGVDATLIKDRANEVQRRRQEIEAILAGHKDEPIVFHPNMAARYRTAIRDLIQTFNKEENRQEARNTLRTLIDKIVLTPIPEEKRLAVDLIGDLAGILGIATNRDRKAVSADLSKLQPVQFGEEGSPAAADDSFPADDNSAQDVQVRFPNRQKESPPFQGGSSLMLVAGGRTTREKPDILAMVAGAGFHHNLRPEQVKMVAGGRNHLYLRSGGGRPLPVGAPSNAGVAAPERYGFLSALFRAAA